MFRELRTKKNLLLTSFYAYNLFNAKALHHVKPSETTRQL